MNFFGMKGSFIAVVMMAIQLNTAGQAYQVVDTGQQDCFDTLVLIAPPDQGEAFFGQDAQFNGNLPAYQDNGDGTITDLVTGLMWQQHLFTDKMTYEEALAGADTCSLSGYEDWRLPTIKELYSLIDFSGLTSLTAETSIPFIDTTFFEFRYGDESAGERFIDAQFVSSTEYVGTTMNGDFTVFGVNFADGRIKGYGTFLPGRAEKTFEVRYVRGNPDYGLSDFEDNGDGTVIDSATGLMWTQNDSGNGMKWEDALSWVQQNNAENFLGYNDWRLPNAKELQSIIDYSRSLQTSNSAAIDPVFECSTIVDEGGSINYPFYWASTTHADGPPDQQYTKAVYVCFGEALGFMEVPPNSGNYELMDVHGAGAQRSDPKVGNPDNYPYGFGPQGDVIRIFNYVRMVRDAGQSSGMNDIGSLPDWISIYPNPVSDILNIRLEKQAENPVLIEILDSSGRRIFITPFTVQDFSMKTSAFKPGMYVVLIKADAEVFLEKIIVF
jgi:hypothetical protein